jgi:hypothetical protein
MNNIRSMQLHQRGSGMTGFLLVILGLVVVGIFTIKLVPAYIEFFSIKQVLVSMGQSSGIRAKSNDEIRTDFERRASIDSIETVKPSDLMIDRSSGFPVISAEYEFRTPFVGNVSLVINFSASTDPDDAPAQIE